MTEDRNPHPDTRPSKAAETTRIPLVEERLSLDRESEVTGWVHVSSRVEVDERLVRETLESRKVRVERRPADRLSDEPPHTREEGDRVVVPVYREVLVKRFQLTEEIHLITEIEAEEVERPVELRRNVVEVRREE